MVANWFFPWNSGLLILQRSCMIIYIYIYIYIYIWENTIRNWLRIGFFQWKRGLLLLHEITICNYMCVCIYIYIYIYINIERCHIIFSTHAAP